MKSLDWVSAYDPLYIKLKGIGSDLILISQGNEKKGVIQVDAVSRMGSVFLSVSSAVLAVINMGSFSS